ncbi:MAG: MBL fold metallo-hydrolase [Solirubrobacterales bacterium]
MQIHTLASGSRGNAVYLQFGQTRILVDAGISARRLERGLAEVGASPGTLSAIFLTHEHADHIQGLEVFTRRFQVPVYTRPATWEAIACRDRLPADCRMDLAGPVTIGLVRAVPFPISHDAAAPVGYSFFYRSRKVVLVTDLGTITPSVTEAATDSDVLILETNHDPHMLETGPYPHFLKKRIQGRYGHLSNSEAAQFASKLEKKSCCTIIMAHRSQQNNTPELAETQVSQTLHDHGYRVGKDIFLRHAHQDHVESLIVPA